MSTKAEALRNMAEHAAAMLEGNPPLQPFDMAGQGAKYARAVAASTLAASVLRYVAEIVVDDEEDAEPAPAGVLTVPADFSDDMLARVQASAGTGVKVERKTPW